MLVAVRGAVALLMMLALLLYSLRKHVRFMHSWGPTKHWFRLHMFLGIAGPTHWYLEVGAAFSPADGGRLLAIIEDACGRLSLLRWMEARCRSGERV